MEYIGKIYRPWMEYKSLLIQVTYGCSYNTCTFCSMFDDKKFGIRDLEEVFKDIDEASVKYYVDSIFLIDGNVMVIKSQILLQILNRIKEKLPECDNVSLYASFRDIANKTDEELFELKNSGLDTVYVGLESGSEIILDKVKKQLTIEEVVLGMAKAREAGIKVLVSIILGLGGKDDSKEHIVKTTELLNQIQPDEIAPMVLTVQPNTKLESEISSGEFVQATPLQILEEEKYLLENLDFKTYYWGDHGNNILSLRGNLPDFKDKFLQRINEAIDKNPVTNDEIYYSEPW